MDVSLVSTRFFKLADLFSVSRARESQLPAERILLLFARTRNGTEARVSDDNQTRRMEPRHFPLSIFKVSRSSLGNHSRVFMDRAFSKRREDERQ